MSRRGLHRRYGHARDPHSAFKAAVSKIKRMIVERETGMTESSSEDLPVFNAINKLEDNIYKKWREHGDDARRETEEMVAKGLRFRMREAIDGGHQARQARRYGEIQSIKERERERLANMTPFERQTYNYQQELKLTRGGR
jgi:hypothetical protein